VSGRTGRRRRLGGDGGFVAAELALGVGLLVFPVALLVLTLPGWSERQTTARAIARETARLVTTTGTCAVGPARALAGEMAANLGLTPSDVQLAVACTPGVPLVPGSDLEVAITVRMPAVRFPGFGEAGEWSWTARHREPVDRYGSAP